MRITAVLLLCGFLLASAAGVRAAEPPGDVMLPIQTFLAITEGRSTVNIDSLFTPDAVVIDEGAPYRWTGPHAASAWLAHIKSVMNGMKMADFEAAAGPAVEYSRSDDGAYVILPMSLTADAPKPFHETGTLTFTLVRAGNEWKISSDTWTTAKRY